MHKFSIFLLSFFLPLMLLAKSNTVVKIDLTAEQDHNLKIKIVPDQTTQNELLYIFAKISPGCYENDDYGRFISNFIIHYKDSTTKNAIKKDTNAYFIKNGTNVAYISYDVQQTYELDQASFKHRIFNASVTNFDKRSYFLLNFHAIVGYLEYRQDDDYTVEITKREESFGIGALPKKNFRQIYGPTHCKFI